MEAAKWANFKWLWLSGIALVLDQITKIVVSANLTLGEVIPVFAGFNIRLAHNYGAAFSFLSDQGGWQRWFFTIIAISVTGMLLVWLYKLPKGDWKNGAAFSLIIGGAIGNLYDRVAYGYVVDFLDVYYKSHHWPAFNIADSAICLGAGFIIWSMLVDPQPEDPAKEEG